MPLCLDILPYVKHKMKWSQLHSPFTFYSGLTITQAVGLDQERQLVVDEYDNVATTYISIKNLTPMDPYP
jgi:hypothetical protein